MESTPIVLVPGYWLGAWAWDEVVAALRADGHDVTAVTLPGLESADADRSGLTSSDHVDAICSAVESAWASVGASVVLAVHSGAGVPGYAVTDRIPERIAAAVYVDTAPGIGSSDPSDDAVELPFPGWEQLSADGENLDGLTDDVKEMVAGRAVPQPSGPTRAGDPLTNDARLDVPSTVICTSFTSEQFQEAAKEGYAWMAGLPELRDVTYVDLPTSHWPMWSRPGDLAAIIGDVAKRHAPSA